MSQSFIVFQLMYLILDSLNDENPNESVIAFLSDANPFMRKGENSVDVVLYHDFKEKFIEKAQNFDFYYDYVDSYLKSLNYYQNVYSLFKSLEKQEYIDSCKERDLQEVCVFLSTYRHR